MLKKSLFVIVFFISLMVLTGCKPTTMVVEKVVKETVIVEKVIRETVVVEKIITVIVEETVVVEAGKEEGLEKKVRIDFTDIPWIHPELGSVCLLNGNGEIIAGETALRKSVLFDELTLTDDRVFYVRLGLFLTRGQYLRLVSRKVGFCFEDLTIVKLGIEDFSLAPEGKVRLASPPSGNFTDKTTFIWRWPNNGGFLEKNQVFLLTIMDSEKNPLFFYYCDDSPDCLGYYCLEGVKISSQTIFWRVDVVEYREDISLLSGWKIVSEK